MKRFVLAAALVLSAAGLFAGAQSARSNPESAAFAGDTVHSFILFKVKHMQTSWSWGRFNDFTASVDVSGSGELTGAAFEVKAESIDTGNEGRDKHLRSPDFLNAKQHPTITFKSTAAKAIDKDTTELTGNLTLLGETKPVTLKAVKTGEGKGRDGESLVGYEATFTVKRSDFGMKYGVPAVGDEIHMTVSIEGMKK